MDDDLYRILGVLPDAEDIVVAAAYRALAQKYHPDRFAGSPSEAHERMTEINRAYSTLGDRTKRQQYDQAHRQRGSGSYPLDDQAQADAFSAALDQLDGRWRIAASVFPEIDALRTRLNNLSTMLALSFATILLETKDFARSRMLANRIEQSFLERYFGTNAAIVQYARLLAAFKLRQPLLALNTLVDVLGSAVDSELVIKKIEGQFGANSIGPANTGLDRRDSELIRAIGSFRRDSFFLGDAKMLASALGYQVAEVPAGIFSNNIVLTDGDGSRKIFKAKSEFVCWAREEFSDRAG